MTSPPDVPVVEPVTEEQIDSAEGFVDALALLLEQRAVYREAVRRGSTTQPEKVFRQQLAEFVRAVEVLS